MKVVKYIIGIIAVLFIAVLLIGIIKPKVAYDCEVIVEKPLVESWIVSQDEEKMPEWLDGFQKVEHISGPKGEVGSVSEVYFVQNGQSTVIRETITEIKPNESISMLFETDFMDMDYQISMSPFEGKTKISSTTVAKGNGLFSKAMMAVMRSSIKMQEEVNLQNLKSVIEKNTKSYASSSELQVD